MTEPAVHMAHRHALSRGKSHPNTWNGNYQYIGTDSITRCYLDVCLSCTNSEPQVPWSECVYNTTYRANFRGMQISWMPQMRNKISRSPVWACRCLHCVQGVSTWRTQTSMNDLPRYWYFWGLLLAAKRHLHSICCICRYPVYKAVTVWLTSVTAVLQRKLEARNSTNPYMVAVKMMVKLLATYKWQKKTKVRERGQGSLHKVFNQSITSHQWMYLQYWRSSLFLIQYKQLAWKNFFMPPSLHYIVHKQIKKPWRQHTSLSHSPAYLKLLRYHSSNFHTPYCPHTMPELPLATSLKTQNCPALSTTSPHSHCHMLSPDPQMPCKSSYFSQSSVKSSATYKPSYRMYGMCNSTLCCIGLPYNISWLCSVFLVIISEWPFSGSYCNKHAHTEWRVAFLH